MIFAFDVSRASLVFERNGQPHYVSVRELRAIGYQCDAAGLAASLPRFDRPAILPAGNMAQADAMARAAAKLRGAHG